MQLFSACLQILACNVVIARRADLGEQAGHILAGAVAHVAGRSQFPHAGVHKGEASLALRPPSKPVFQAILFQFRDRLGLPPGEVPAAFSEE